MFSHSSRTEPRCTGRAGSACSISAPNLTRSREETPRVKQRGKKRGCWVIGVDFPWQGLVGCPRVRGQERSGNTAELEEQPLRALFLLLPPPFLCLESGSGWDRLRVLSQVTPWPWIPLTAGMGSRGAPQDPPLLSDLFLVPKGRGKPYTPRSQMTTRTWQSLTATSAHPGQFQHHSPPAKPLGDQTHAGALPKAAAHPRGASAPGLSHPPALSPACGGI